MDDNTQKYLSILAVCTGNICRSPMAEGILRSLLANRDSINISSAGTHAIRENTASEFAVIVADENGIDISGHRARLLDAKIIKDSNIILCMEPYHIECVLSLDTSAYGKAYNLAEFSDDNKKQGKIPDPYGSSLREYRECFNNLYTCINNFLATIDLDRRNFETRDNLAGQ